MADEFPTADGPNDQEPLDLTGRTLGDFQVLRKLGQGGMGQVYLARQISLKREVALKILRSELAENSTALKRFQAEAEAIARISHPNIVQVYAIGESQGIRYMALEYVPGRNLREFLERKGPPELPITLMIMRQVAAALQRANELGLVHRDIKPENILLTRKAEVKVTDFGLSRYFAGETRPVSLTQSGMTLGTPLYMSPEQVQGKPVDHRSDLYSFGVTCYHLLAGHPPYQGANAFDVAVQHVQGQAIPLAELRPDLPAPLTQLIAQMMARSANDRPANAKEVLRQISRIQKAVSEGTIEPATGTVPGLAVSMTGVALGTSGMSSGLTLTHPVSHSGMVPVPSSRWPWRILGFLALGAVLALGWFALSLVSPTQEPAPVPTIVGLPEERPPTVISIREQQYREGFLARPVTNKVVLAGLKLGLLLLSERRLSEASTLFGELEELKAPIGKNSDVVIPPGVLGKFGLGAVLAFSDKPEEALAQFQAGESLLRQVRPPIPRTEIERFFFQNIDFAQVVAESLARIAESQKLPTQLEWLRTPNGILRGNR